MKCNPGLSLALFLFCLLAPAAAAAGMAEPGAPAGITLEPASIPIGMNYNGATVHVGAAVPAGYEAAIRVMGTAETLEMKRKGRVGGVLWMSVGEATFTAVPAVYFLLTSRPLTDLAPAEALREWMLGYEGLAGAAGWDAALSPELIKLKETEGCFLVEEGRLVRSGPVRGGSTQWVTGSFRFPARAPAGGYTVELFGFHEGRVLRLGSTTLRLEYTGMARALRSVAAEHGLIYGGAAVVGAVLAGLFTGFVFHPKRRRGK